jgi:hypothetical protein
VAGIPPVVVNPVRRLVLLFLQLFFQTLGFAFGLFGLAAGFLRIAFRFLQAFL